MMGFHNVGGPTQWKPTSILGKIYDINVENCNIQYRHDEFRNFPITDRGRGERTQNCPTLIEIARRYHGFIDIDEKK
jgi:hypothetical protein